MQAIKKIFLSVPPFPALNCVLQNANPSLRRKKVPLLRAISKRYSLSLVSYTVQLTFGLLLKQLLLQPVEKFMWRH
jgi:hypothetical protein